MSVKELLDLLHFSRRKEHLPTRFVINDVPYYSQWESPSLVGKLIRDEIAARDDPFWEKSGAHSREEYEFWARNMCGMACLKMIIEHRFARTVPIIDLGKRCLKYGGYVLGPNTIDGMYYSPFVKFVKEEFDLDAKVVGPVSIHGVIEKLSHGNYVIASVSPKIRNSGSKSHTKGGHLVLLLGYDLEKQTILFHNPSGDTKENQEYAEIPFLQFENFFARKGIIVEK